MDVRSSAETISLEDVDEMIKDEVEAMFLSRMADLRAQVAAEVGKPGSKPPKYTSSLRRSLEEAACKRKKTE